MKKNSYKVPDIKIVTIKIESLLGSESMAIDNTHTVTNDNAVFSRGGSWDGDEE